MRFLLLLNEILIKSDKSPENIGKYYEKKCLLLNGGVHTSERSLNLSFQKKKLPYLINFYFHVKLLSSHTISTSNIFLMTPDHIVTI